MRIGIVSDIHGQHRALELALKRMERLDTLICAGDILDQSRFCDRTVSLLREADAKAIVGNHDLHLMQTMNWRNGTDPALALWLEHLPLDLRLELGGMRIRVVHATPMAGDFAYITPGHSRFAGFADPEADVVIYGHTHVPVVRRLEQTLVINPGSVGEGRPDARGFVRSCAVLDTTTGGAKIIDLD